MSIREMISVSQFNYEKKYRLFSLLCCPFFLMRRNLYKYIRHYAPQLVGSVLDFGCGSKPYQHLFTNCTEYVGVDIDGGHDHKNEDVDVYYDGYTLPFANDSFDNVFSSEVIEHIDHLDKSLSEINRVLKKDGLFLLTVPFVWNENEMPYDFARYTSIGIKKILNNQGFKVLKYAKTTNYYEMLCQMRAEYYRGVVEKTGNMNLQRMVQLGLIAPLSLKGIVMGKLYPKDWSFFGNNIILCQKVR